MSSFYEAALLAQIYTLDELNEMYNDAPFNSKGEEINDPEVYNIIYHQIPAVKKSTCVFVSIPIMSELERRFNLSPQSCPLLQENDFLKSGLFIYFEGHTISAPCHFINHERCKINLYAVLLVSKYVNDNLRVFAIPYSEHSYHSGMDEMNMFSTGMLEITELHTYTIGSPEHKLSSLMIHLIKMMGEKILIDEDVIVSTEMKRSCRRSNLCSWTQEPHLSVLHYRQFEEQVTDTQPSPSPTKDHEERHWSCQWEVDGFWRNQWYPSMKVHKRIFVPGFRKGPKDKPLKEKSQKIIAVVR